MERVESYPIENEPDKYETPAKKQQNKDLHDPKWQEVETDKEEKKEAA